MSVQNASMKLGKSRKISVAHPLCAIIEYVIDRDPQAADAQVSASFPQFNSNNRVVVHEPEIKRDREL